MGNQLKLSQVAEYRESKYGGKGLFALCSLRPGTLLKADKESAQLNDADMEYPSSFERDELKRVIGKYETRSTCNLEFINDDLCKVTRHVLAGDELTKRYGMPKWSGWLWLDIHAENVWRPRRETPDKEEAERLVDNLKHAMAAFGYNIEITNPSGYCK